MPERKTRKKKKIGVVLSNKMDKTIVVEVERTIAHPRIGKVMRRINTFKAHDEKNECRIGDRVLIMETRPISKHKCWRLVEILEKTKDKSAAGLVGEVKA
ncbi:MAG: 30S ribosomal protein S17 [Candidatus Saganbacteria bacterium]|nr:30S ribosomal protein S17 [Candidatus Saganbacteria bacterium]